MQSTLTDEQIFKSIVEGLVVDGKRRMRPYTELSTDEVRDLVEHMRKFNRPTTRAQASAPASPKST